jgi:hypothetical protein
VLALPCASCCRCRALPPPIRASGAWAIACTVLRAVVSAGDARCPSLTCLARCLLSTGDAAMNMIDNVLASKPAASLDPYSAKFEGERTEKAPANKFPAGGCSLRMCARSRRMHGVVGQLPALYSLPAASTSAPGSRCRKREGGGPASASRARNAWDCVGGVVLLRCLIHAADSCLVFARRWRVCTRAGVLQFMDEALGGQETKGLRSPSGNA